MIDLHTHTTASDGRDAPDALVARAAAAGLEVLAVTDHDTVAGWRAAAAAAAVHRVQLVPGIEVTAVLEDVDVHVLGYFIDIRSAPLLEFLAAQRRLRLDRVREMVARLAALGIQLDVDAILAPGLDDEAKAAGRPWIAKALVHAGRAATISEAFERWLGRGRPAFVPRVGVPPAAVIERLHEAGGIASLAHPGLTECDDRIPEFVAAGLDAIEVYHSRHDAATTERYRMLADRLGVAMTGGSDYHGDVAPGAVALGDVVMPSEAYAHLVAIGRRAASRATASGSSTSS